MPIGNQKLSELQVLLDPVMRYLRDNFNPHTSIRVDSEISEIVEGVAGLLRTDRVLDVAESNTPISGQPPLPQSDGLPSIKETP